MVLKVRSFVFSQSPSKQPRSSRRLPEGPPSRSHAHKDALRPSFAENHACQCRAQELERLEDDSNVFKLIGVQRPAAPRSSARSRPARRPVRRACIPLLPLRAGPVLIKQDPVEAKATVSKRIEYIKGERRAPTRGAASLLRSVFAPTRAPPGRASSNAERGRR